MEQSATSAVTPKKAMYICLLVAWLFFLIPIPFTSIIAYPLIIATLILAVICFVRNDIKSGIVGLVLTLVGSPIVYFISLGLFLGVVNTSLEEKAKEDKPYTSSNFKSDMKSWKDNEDQKVAELMTIQYKKKEKSEYKKHQRKYEEKMLVDPNNKLAWISNSIYKHGSHAWGGLQNCGKRGVVSGDFTPGSRVIVVKNRDNRNCLFTILDYVEKKNNKRDGSEYKDYPVCGTWYPCDSLEFE